MALLDDFLIHQALQFGTLALKAFLERLPFFLCLLYDLLSPEVQFFRPLTLKCCYPVIILTLNSVLSLSFADSSINLKKPNRAKSND
jgi:hypothetical protein